MRTHSARIVLGLFLIMLFAGITLSRQLPLRIATGGSLPKGVYWIDAPSFSRGSIALVCLPESIAKLGLARGYLHSGSCPGGVRAVGKPAVAIPGDFISLGQGEIAVNGARIAHHDPPDIDSRGRPLAHVPDGVYEVGPDEVWLISTHHPRSWDSRYFGPVSMQRVVGEVRPIWIFSPDVWNGWAR